MQTRDHIHCSSQCGGHILYCSRIIKNVTENREQKTDRQREKVITEASLIVDGSSGWVGQYFALHLYISVVVLYTLEWKMRVFIEVLEFNFPLSDVCGCLLASLRNKFLIGFRNKQDSLSWRLYLWKFKIQWWVSDVIFFKENINQNEWFRINLRNKNGMSWRRVLFFFP